MFVCCLCKLLTAVGSSYRLNFLFYLACVVGGVGTDAFLSETLPPAFYHTHSAWEGNVEVECLAQGDNVIGQAKYSIQAI